MKTVYRRHQAGILIISIAAGVAAAAVVLGAAESLPFNSQQAGAGYTTVPRCSTVGITAFENVSGSSIVSVSLANVDATCAGGTLSLTVNNGTTTGSGSAAVPGGGGSMTIALGSAVPFIDNASVDLVVVGP